MIYRGQLEIAKAQVKDIRTNAQEMEDTLTISSLLSIAVFNRECTMFHVLIAQEILGAREHI